GKPTTDKQPLFVGTGKVGIQFERVFPSFEVEYLQLARTLSKLATGKLELECKSKVPPARNDGDKKEVPTWGKPVKGLQAGIRVNPNGHTGALDLEVVVRNVGKEVIEFDHLQLAFGGENSEGTVTAKGVEVYGSFTPKGSRFKAKLAPGESHTIAHVP